MASKISCQTTFTDLISCLSSSATDYLTDVDWASEAKYIGAAIFTAALILPPLFYISAHFSPPTWLLSLLDKIPTLVPNWLTNFINNLQSFNPGETRLGRFLGFSPPRSQPRRIYIYPPRAAIYDSSKDFTRRISISKTTVTLFAYPSKGGVIVLSPAYGLDLEFLCLDRLHPPIERFSTQNEEDEFCKKMLMLGAKWWDSLSRHYLVTGAQEGEEDCEEALEYDDTVPSPTVRERLWCSVAWPSAGGLVIAEFHSARLGHRNDGGREYEIPEDVGRLGLCADMDERAAMLRERFEGKFFASVEDYDEEGGDAFLGAWGWKIDGKGEVGALEKTW